MNLGPESGARTARRAVLHLPLPDAFGFDPALGRRSVRLVADALSDALKSQVDALGPCASSCRRTGSTTCSCAGSWPIRRQALRVARLTHARTRFTRSRNPPCGRHHQSPSRASSRGRVFHRPAAPRSSPTYAPSLLARSSAPPPPPAFLPPPRSCASLHLSHQHTHLATSWPAPQRARSPPPLCRSSYPSRAMRKPSPATRAFSSTAAFRLNP